MDKERVKHILDNCQVPDSCKNSELIETHISWILLTDNFAFKIKRPVQYSFVDFSTVEKREFYCGEELRLNRRIEPEMYLDVLPVTDRGIENKETENTPVDYAVRMKRMDNRKAMDIRLRKNEVAVEHIDSIARKIARFHSETKVVKNAFRTREFHETFADIGNHKDFISENLDDEYLKKTENSVRQSFEYLNAIRSFSNERVISGFQRDCHGDLNAGNIFLYEDEPVIFDCIEYNKEFRQIDVLNEIAFLCVDFDFFGKENFSELFFEKYMEYSGMKDEPETRELFNYYKSFRANVRAKVSLISAGKKAENNEENDKELTDAEKYIDLMEKYMTRAKK